MFLVINPFPNFYSKALNVKNTHTSESSGGWFPAMDLMDDHHTRNLMDLHLEIP